MRHSLEQSNPHEVRIDGATSRFLTSDPYSYNRFYPRYRRGRLHEEAVTLDFAKEASASGVIVDIGANLGWFTCIAGSANRDATVDGFELDDVNLGICSKNLVLNNLTNVELEHCAVSNIDGEIEYLKNSERGASAMHRLGSAGPVKQRERSNRTATDGTRLQINE